MRTTKLIATLLVAGLAIAACKQDPDYVLPGITLSTTTLDFSTDSEQSLELLATRDWQVLGKPEWVTEIRPSSGTGSNEPQRVMISVDPNDGYNRDGEIVFTIGLAKSALALRQPGAKGEIPVGSGTLEDPYTVTGIMDVVKKMASGAESSEAVYIKGKISRIAMSFGDSGTYGNANFYISEDGSYNEGKDFYCFQVYYLGGVKWKTGDEEIRVGDDVIVCGKVTNYNGNTPETTGKGTAYIYELNGVNKGSSGGGGGQGGDTGTPSGTGTLADPYNAAAANAYIQTLADNAKSDKDVYIKGKISKIAVSKNVEQYFSAEYGNASFYISDDGQTGGTDFYCYQVLYLGNEKWKEGNTQIKVGDEVIICGKVTKYVSSYGATPETARNEAYIYSLNGTTEAGSGGQGGNEGGGGQQQEGSIFSQAFKTDGQGSFTIDNKILPEGLEYIWAHDTKYGMKASAFKDNKCLASESWLVSPEIDLSAAKKPVMTFSHALNKFASVEAMKKEATLWAKASGGEWSELSGLSYSENSNWNFVDSGEIDLSAYVGKKVQIAFKYVSSASSAGTWEVDNFVVKEK